MREPVGTGAPALDEEAEEEVVLPENNRPGLLRARPRSRSPVRSAASEDEMEDEDRVEALHCRVSILERNERSRLPALGDEDRIVALQSRVRILEWNERRCQGDMSLMRQRLQSLAEQLHVVAGRGLANARILSQMQQTSQHAAPPTPPSVT